MRAVGEANFQPKIGFKTRYGLVANPFATTAKDGVVITTLSEAGTDVPATHRNIYYRSVNVLNLM